MPELPEVETVRRQLAPRLVNRMIVEAGSHPSAKFTAATATIGCTITGDARRGKFLIFALDDGHELIIHLGMTGSLRFADHHRTDRHRSDQNRSDQPRSNQQRSGQRRAGGDQAYLRAWWALDDGELLEFIDVRRFGRIRVVDAGDYRSIPTLHAAGPEPFDQSFDGEQFWLRLSRSRRKLKTQLLSQRPVAGVGNIYADEALWLAKINPNATRISRARATDLLEAIRAVLSQGIENGGTTLRDYRDAEGRAGANQRALAAYGRGGSPCHRCGSALRSALIDARTTTWCTRCQRR